MTERAVISDCHVDRSVPLGLYEQNFPGAVVGGGQRIILDQQVHCVSRSRVVPNFDVDSFGIGTKPTAVSANHAALSDGVVGDGDVTSGIRSRKLMKMPSLIGRAIDVIVVNDEARSSGFPAGWLRDMPNSVAPTCGQVEVLQRFVADFTDPGSAGVLSPHDAGICDAATTANVVEDVPLNMATLSSAVGKHAAHIVFEAGGAGVVRVFEQVAVSGIRAADAGGHGHS